MCPEGGGGGVSLKSAGISCMVPVSSIKSGIPVRIMCCPWHAPFTGLLYGPRGSDRGPWGYRGMSSWSKSVLDPEILLSPSLASACGGDARPGKRLWYNSTLESPPEPFTQRGELPDAVSGGATPRTSFHREGSTHASPQPSRRQGKQPPRYGRHLPNMQLDEPTSHSSIGHRAGFGFWFGSA